MRRLAGILLAAVLAACAPAPAPTPVGAERPDPTAREQVGADLKEGDFPSALARIARQVKGGRPEADFWSEYPRAINGVLALAGKQIAAKQCHLAGPLLRQALDAYPQRAEVARRIAQPPAAIDDNLQLCTDRLMEKGLLAYRDGRLEEAIVVWKQLLAFNPDHSPARQAVETASRQVHHLRAIE